MLEPILPDVLESNRLLDRALKQLGLTRVWQRPSPRSTEKAWVVVDRKQRPYHRVKNAKDGFGSPTTSSLEDLLDTEWFEHHHFALFNDAENYTVIVNPFHNMTKEELAVRLDLLEA